MQKLIAAGWVQKKSEMSESEIEAAYLADEMERLRYNVKVAEFCAKLFAAKQEKKPQVGLALEAVKQPRWYRGQSNLDNQCLN